MTPRNPPIKQRSVKQRWRRLERRTRPDQSLGFGGIQPQAWRDLRFSRPWNVDPSHGAGAKVRLGTDSITPSVPLRRRPQRSQVSRGPGAKVERRSGVPQFPSPPSETPSRPAPSSRSTFPNAGKHGVGRRRTDGAGVESFPRTLPQSLCHSRNAATGREQVAHVTEAAGPPHVDSRPKGGEGSRGVPQRGSGAEARTRSSGKSTRFFGDSLAAVLSAWALASATSGQDVHGQEGNDDDRGRDSNDGDGGGGYNHTAILPRRAGSKPRPITGKD
jgi:hypothetical protein